MPCPTCCHLGPCVAQVDCCGRCYQASKKEASKKEVDGVPVTSRFNHLKAIKAILRFLLQCYLKSHYLDPLE